MSETANIITPCIGVCSTGIGDNICRGCKRFAHEVIAWNTYRQDERAHIMARIDALTGQIMQNYIWLIDEPLLQRMLQQHAIRVTNLHHPYSLAYEAIRSFGNQMQNLSSIGCQAQYPWQSYTISELKKIIDEALFQLSSAHYERYFVV